MSQTSVDVRLVAPARLGPNPSQPRTVFDAEELASLASTLTTSGMLQPIVVTPSDDDMFTIVAGERRWRAARMARMELVPVLVRPDVGSQQMRTDALLENLSRVALNPLETATAFDALLTDGLTQEDIASVVGCSRSHVGHTVSLLRLPPTVAARLAAGVLSAGHGKILVTLAHDPDQCEALAKKIVAEGMSVAATMEYLAVDAESLSADPTEAKTRSRHQLRPEMLTLQVALCDRLDTKVSVVAGKKKGQIVIDFADDVDRQRLGSLLLGHAPGPVSDI